MMSTYPERILCATEFLDSDTPVVRNFVRQIVGSEQDATNQSIKLFYAVRDNIRYDIYGIDLSRAGMKASTIINNGVGFCIHKSIVYAAAARCLGIPSRLAFADVRNHISTERLREIVGGDVFHYHAYAEIYLNGRWIKVTPVFNRPLCHLFGVDPLDFDGLNDATLQPYDRRGNRYLEFLRYHGCFEDFPYERCMGTLKLHHPRLFKKDSQTRSGNLVKERGIRPIIEGESC
jgi:transglutaminase-like putative cysteine protease